MRFEDLAILLLLLVVIRYATAPCVPTMIIMSELSCYVEFLIPCRVGTHPIFSHYFTATPAGGGQTGCI